jgi:plastocyanin
MENTQLAEIKVFRWRTLLSLAALANLAVLLFMGLVQRDSLALILAAITLAGLGLTRFRSGVLGILLLGLLFTDIAIWTASGAVNNFLHREHRLALLLPSFLGAISSTGLIAAVGTWIFRNKKDGGSRLAVLVGTACLALLIIACAASLLLRTPEARAPQAAELVLGSKNMLYSTSDITANAGEITVKLTNDDLWWHTFTIDELGVDLHVPMGADRSVSFEAPAGDYYFYCSIPGHEAIGMHGLLKVTEK